MTMEANELWGNQFGFESLGADSARWLESSHALQGFYDVHAVKPVIIEVWGGTLMNNFATIIPPLFDTEDEARYCEICPNVLCSFCNVSCPDMDGDSICDEYDPCPEDPNNQCHVPTCLDADFDEISQEVAFVVLNGIKLGGRSGQV